MSEVLAIIGLIMFAGGTFVGVLGLVVNGIEEHWSHYLLASSSKPHASLGDRVGSIAAAVAVVGLLIILCISASWGIIDPTALQLKL